MCKRLIMFSLLLIFSIYFLSGCGSDGTQLTSAPTSAPEVNEPQTPDDNALPESPLDIIQDIAIGESMEAEGILRIAQYYDDDLFANVLDIFQTQHPGWEVEVIKLAEFQEYFDDDGNSTGGGLMPDFSKDVLRMIENNEVDLVNASGDVFDRLIKSDLMQDLLLLFQNDVEMNLNRMLPNIRELLMYEGKQPLMPVWFSYKGLEPHANITLADHGEIPTDWTWAELVDWCKNDFLNNNVTLLIGGYPDQFLYGLFGDYHLYFQGAEPTEVNFDSPVIKEILNAVRFLYEEGRLNNKDVLLDEVLRQINEGSYLFYDTTPNYIINYTTMESAWGKVYPYPVIPETTGKSVTITSAYGINAASPVSTKMAAWEFIRILLSDEIQNGDLIWHGANPVISEMSKAGLARLYYSDITEESITDEEIAEFNRQRQEFFSDVNRLSNMLSDPLLQALAMGASDYIDGTIEMDQAIDRMKTEWNRQITTNDIK